MFRTMIIILGLLLVLSTTLVNAQCPDKKTAAITAANSWLSKVDNQKYAESWTDAAKFFKNSITQQQWTQAVGSVRAPLGKLVSRKLKSASYQTSLPGAPDGEYVVIQFNTTFANKKSAVETITPMLDSDKKWRVSGYFIK